MITGTQLLIYSTNPEADREFFRDVLEFKSVDAGEGWLIFKTPPAEAGIHPSEDQLVHQRERDHPDIQRPYEVGKHWPAHTAGTQSFLFF